MIPTQGVGIPTVQQAQWDLVGLWMQLTGLMEITLLLLKLLIQPARRASL